MNDLKSQLITKECIYNNEFISSNLANNEQYDINYNKIIAIFVVDFHYKTGNIIEYSYPKGINLCGIEYKSIVSGSHLVKKDFVYFKNDQYYGVGFFCSKNDFDSEHRGVKMKTVGVLCTNPDYLNHYLSFLETAVMNILVKTGKYEKLEAFYHDEKNKEKNLEDIALNKRSDSIILADIDIEMTSIDPNKNVDHLMNQFGQQLFLLWKLILLRKRIIFIASPPIGPLCQFVLFCSKLGQHTVKQWFYLRHKLLLNITMNDVNPDCNGNNNEAAPSFLTHQSAFIASTTDQILLADKFRNYLYDVAIVMPNEARNDQRQPIRFMYSTGTNQIPLSDSDKIRLNKLNQIRSSFDESNNSWLECVSSYFQSENDRVLHCLADLGSQASQEPNQEISSRQIQEQFGFHPSQDREFLLGLLTCYGVDVSLQIETGETCC